MTPCPARAARARGRRARGGVVEAEHGRPGYAAAPVGDSGRIRRRPSPRVAPVRPGRPAVAWMRTIPDKPTLDGLEARWAERWDADGHLPLRPRRRARDEVFSIDTPPPTVSAARCTSATSSATPTPTPSPATSACAASEVFYPMGWDDNGLPTERRVQNYFGVRCDPSPALRPGLRAAVRGDPPKDHRAIADLAGPTSSSCASELTGDDEQAFEALFRRLGLSVDWTLLYTTIDDRSRARQPAGLPAQPRPRRGVPAGGADAVGRRLPHRRRPGRAGGPRAARRLPPASPSTAPTATATSSSTPPGPSCSRPASRSSPTPTTSATSRCSARRCARRCSASRCRSSPTSWPTPRRAPASP